MVEEELERLEKNGTIASVKSSRWASPIVPVVKDDGSVRICGDYKIGVNKALVVDVYPLPTPEDLFATLAGGAVFSKLDLSHAYQQLPLSEESKEIVTINTHKGLYTYNRLPFGISSAPAVFQRTLETLLSNIDGVGLYLDDILVCGRNIDEHDSRLREVLKRLSKAGLKLKKSKCLIGVPEVIYLGHKVSASGIQPLPEKVRAIAEAPAPIDKPELQSYIGMVTYYDKFLPQLSTVLEPLHRLLRKDAKFVWKQAQQEAFEKSKQMLQCSPVLAHYDPSKPLVLTVDASAYGLGAVLAHAMEDKHDQPIAYKSRKLTETERRYAVLDKEALAIAFGLKKFHKYLYGRQFVIITDHKPLLGLLGEDKSIPAMTSPRLQRFAIAMTAYMYKLIHRPGAQIANADGLSRLPLPDTVENTALPAATVLSMNVLDSTPVTSDNVKRWTNEDPVLS